jgi:hypothetical protein
MLDQEADDTLDRIAKAMTGTLHDRFPGRLNAEQLGHVTETVAELLRAASRLRSQPLTNADEPDPIFRSFRLED